ncbi:hypothetical protein J2Z43_002963 [Clostridioides mangenotii]|uniref:Uncharacterized protein n=1 Tax=Metaclostridioides mangenotii TaxID=1540 RepID=A0ABS4EF03_9FIRM|nr:hypothetical protein [Clostridioides mangenotii]
MRNLKNIKSISVYKDIKKVINNKLDLSLRIVNLKMKSKCFKYVFLIIGFSNKVRELTSCSINLQII